MLQSEPTEQSPLVNPPAAAIVDDLVAAALLLRCAATGSERSDDIGPLCATAAARLEVAAAALRGPGYLAALHTLPRSHLAPTAAGEASATHR